MKKQKNQETHHKPSEITTPITMIQIEFRKKKRRIKTITTTPSAKNNEQIRNQLVRSYRAHPANRKSRCDCRWRYDTKTDLRIKCMQHDLGGRRPRIGIGIGSATKVDFNRISDDDDGDGDEAATATASVIFNVASFTFDWMRSFRRSMGCI